MASSKRCSMCQKGTGIYFCTGCEAYLCKKDFQSHRQTLSNELDGCIEERNILQEKLPKSIEQKNIRNPVLLQIDDWEKSTIEKIKQAAEQVRKKVLQILNTKRTKITSAFDKLSHELIQLKETEDFAEQELKRLRESIKLCNQDLNQLAKSGSIELHTEESQKIAWNRLIYILDETNRSDKKPNDKPKQSRRNMSLVNSMEQVNMNHSRRATPTDFINRRGSISPPEDHSPINFNERSSPTNSLELRNSPRPMESPSSLEFDERSSPIHFIQNPPLISPMERSNQANSIELASPVSFSQRMPMNSANRSSPVSFTNRHSPLNQLYYPAPLYPEISSTGSQLCSQNQSTNVRKKR